MDITTNYVHAQSLAACLTGIIESMIESSEIPSYEMSSLAQSLIECHEKHPIANSEGWIGLWKERYSTLLKPMSVPDDLPF